MNTVKQVINSPRKLRFESEPLTREEKVEYTQAFSLFDHDEDGLISSKELSLLIRSLQCHNPTDHEIQQLINYILDRESNLINCEQFLIMMSILKKSRNIHNTRELRELFDAIDIDGDEHIDREELRIAMSLLFNGNDEIKLTKEEIDEMIAEVDSDNDGRLTFDDFTNIFERQT